jgi:hypothetical protein
MTTLVEKLYPHLAQRLRMEFVKDIEDNWLELPSAEELTTMGIAKTAIGSVRGSSRVVAKPLRVRLHLTVGKLVVRARTINKPDR